MTDTVLDLRQRDRSLDRALDPLDEAQLLDSLKLAYAARMRAVVQGPAMAQAGTAQEVEHLERLCLQRRQCLADVASIDPSYYLGPEVHGLLLTSQGELMSVPEAIDSRTHRVLRGAGRVAVLQALRLNGDPLDVLAIAEQVGLHTNTVRSQLDELMDAGLVEGEVQIGTMPGRPRLLFRATATPCAGAEGS